MKSTINKRKMKELQAGTLKVSFGYRKAMDRRGERIARKARPVIMGIFEAAGFRGVPDMV